MIHSDRARRLLLLLVGAVFAIVATGSLIDPRKMAEPFHYPLDHVDSLSEYRAIYVGLWLAHVVVFSLAAKHVRVSVLGDCAAILVLGQVVGRLVSIVLDGAPTRALWPMSLLELVGGVALLAVRPSRRA